MRNASSPLMPLACRLTVAVPLALPCALLALCTLLALPAAVSAAMSPGAGWLIRSVAEPTHFSPSGDDQYTLFVTNVGSKPVSASEPLVVSDALPQLVQAVDITGENQRTGASLSCTEMPLQCLSGEVLPGDTVTVKIKVAVLEGARSPGECDFASPGECNVASASGGGAPGVTSAERTVFSTDPAPFGVEDFALRAFDEDGSPSTQAGGHPYALATDLYFNSDEFGGGYYAPEQAKDVIVDLPPGLVGNPQSIPKCPLSDLLETSNLTACPPASRIGTALFQRAPQVFHFSEGEGSETSAVYNMEPEPGFPAEFGFTFLGKGVYMYASPVRIDGQLRLRVTVPGIPELEVMGTTLLLWGNPTKHNGGTIGQAPFLTNSADGAGCQTPSEPLSATVEVDTWQHPSSLSANVYPDFAESTTYPQLTGCDLLQFQPRLQVQPETTQADEPSGYALTVQNPQDESPFQPATPDVKDATVTLPAGVSLSPAAADGLRACAATGPDGINIGSGQILARGSPGAGEDASNPEATELGAGHPGGSDEASPYDDGIYHTTPGHCPPASTVATVEVATPLLPTPLEGHIYVAQPDCGGAGQPGCEPADALKGLFGAYLEVAGDGAIVKLEGGLSVNPTTGQITASFLENPQVPFSSLKVSLYGGPRAALANPTACGPATTSADLSSWSAPFTPDSHSLVPFTVDWNGAGGACPAPPPFTPAMVAEMASPAAGAFSTFNFTLSRTDRQQYVSQLSVATPPGLLARIAGVPLCAEPQAVAGTCSAASEIGTTTTAVGAGSHPYWVTGHVYLTTGFNGAPFGLSIVVPAQAGPFNLGNVVVRSAITVDSTTGAVTITSAPLPQIIDGVPLRLQTINVQVGRPGFMFNPTNCSAKQIVATVLGTQGTQAQVSSPFAVAGCKSLPFSPVFTASTQARTSKANGASLDVKVAYKPAQANIKSVAVTLPKQLPARLTTIQQACLAATFEANPAACPAGSLIGVVQARTPVLPAQLTGPAYLVSYGNAAFPDVVVVLQGEGVRVDLRGNINITRKTEVTSSTFANVPDVPVTSFDFNLPEGSHSALAINIPGKDRGNLCGIALKMPTVITGQNGAQIKQSTKIAVSGCPKAQKQKKKKVKAKTAKGWRAR
jgi:hypothetical protein